MATELQIVLDAMKAMSNSRIHIANLRTGIAKTYARSAEDIVARYLMELQLWIMRHLRMQYPMAFLRSAPIDLVITIPAVSYYVML